MRRTLVLLIVLLLVTTPVFAAEEGFWSRFWNKLSGGEADVQESVAPDSATSDPARGREANDASGIAGSGAAAPPTRGEGGAEVPNYDPGVVPAPIPYPAPVYTDTACCNVVVCDDASPNARADEFICPGDLTRCIQQYGESCRQVSCRSEPCTARVHLCTERYAVDNTVNSDEEPRVAPIGYYEDDQQPPSDDQLRTNMPYPEDVPPSGVSTGGVQGTSVSPGAVASYGYRTVKCEGSYEACAEQYYTCQCGYPDRPQ